MSRDIMGEVSEVGEVVPAARQKKKARHGVGYKRGRRVKAPPEAEGVCMRKVGIRPGVQQREMKSRPASRLCSQTPVFAMPCFHARAKSLPPSLRATSTATLEGKRSSKGEEVGADAQVEEEKSVGATAKHRLLH